MARCCLARGARSVCAAAILIVACESGPECGDDVCGVGEVCRPERGRCVLVDDIADPCNGLDDDMDGVPDRPWGLSYASCNEPDGDEVYQCVHGGRCTLTGCSGFAADCNRVLDDGCETDLRSDDRNCGLCGRACEGCVGGACGGRSPARMFAAGDGHACALLQSGRVTCWGSGGSGVLGSPERLTDQGAHEIAGVSDAVWLSSGAYSNCVVLASGGVSCWGANFAGQLGRGFVDLDPSVANAEPAPVVGLPAPATRVETGENHACAVTEAGLYCWGDGERGQLGHGALVISAVPVAVQGLPPGPVDDLAIGTRHTCAIVTGAVYCWGANESGQLGDGTMTDRPFPLRVLDGAVEVSAFRHTCARVADGGVLCWGRNVRGQLGGYPAGRDESDPYYRFGFPSPDPARIEGIDDAVQIGTSDETTCLRRRVGRVTCFGLLVASSLTHLPRPDVASVRDPVDLFMGLTHACALHADGGILCWGSGGSLPRFPRSPAGAGIYPRPPRVEF